MSVPLSSLKQFFAAQENLHIMKRVACSFRTHLLSEYPRRYDIAVLIQFCLFSCFECSTRKQSKLALDKDVNLCGSLAWLNKLCLCLSQCVSCILEEEFVFSRLMFQITKWWMHDLMLSKSLSPSQLNRGPVQNVP